MMQKHWFMRQLGPIDESTETWIDNVYRNRLRTLLSLDDHITLFMKQLKQMGQLDNTFVIYSIRATTVSSLVSTVSGETSVSSTSTTFEFRST